MKQKLFMGALACLLLFTSSCATVFGGRITECQRTKPSPGEPARKVRVVALVADILLFWPGAIVDFADNAIYKPCGDGAYIKPHTPSAPANKTNAIASAARQSITPNSK